MIKPPIDVNIDLIKYPLITNKTDILLRKNKYTFLVDPKMTKTNLTRTIENIFKVKVDRVNSLNLAKKKRRIGQFTGNKPRYKKVIVTLPKNNTIKLFSNY